MCGSSPDKQRPSAHDIALAQTAGRNDQRFVERFMPLEIFEIEQFRDPAVRKINRDVIAGRVNADVARAEAASRRQAIQAAQASGTDLTSEANQAALSENSIATAEAVSQGKIEGDRLARNINDAEGLSIIRTGQSINRGNTENLSGLARQETFKASSRLRDRQMVDQARAAALGKVATTAVIGGYDAFKRGRDPNVSGDDLSMGAKDIRSMLGTRPRELDPSAPIDGGNAGLRFG